MNKIDISERFLHHTFVTDQRGQVIFFPWGSWGYQKKGYILKDKAQEEKIKQFYNRLLLAFFIVILVPISYLLNFLLMIGAVLIALIGYALIWHRFVKNQTSSLPIATASYSEIISEKLSSEKGESEASSTPEN